MIGKLKLPQKGVVFLRQMTLFQFLRFTLRKKEKQVSEGQNIERLDYHGSDIGSRGLSNAGLWNAIHQNSIQPPRAPSAAAGYESPWLEMHQKVVVR